MNKYTWTFRNGEEIYRNDIHDSMAGCIAAACAECEADGVEHERVYIGIVEPFVPRVDGARVLEFVEEDAADFCGEVGSDWDAFDPKKQDELKELDDALTAVAVAWMDKYGYAPRMYAVTDVMEYPLWRRGRRDA